DVLPDIQFGPVADRKDAHVFARMHARVIEAPQLGALVLRIPLTELVAEREHALLGARLLLVAPGAADTGVELLRSDGFEQGDRLGHVAALVRPPQLDGATPNRVLHRTYEQPHAQFRDASIAELYGFGKVMPGVDVQNGKWDRPRTERFLRQSQYHCRVFAPGKQQRGARALA